MNVKANEGQIIGAAKHSRIALTVPMFAIHHHKIGGTESAIYNLVMGLAQADVDLSLAFSDKTRFSTEFQSWMDQSPHVKALVQSPLPGSKNSRFFEETIFELLRRPDTWALYPNYFLPPRIRHKPAAVILHDIQYKVLPQYHSSKRKAWLDFYLPRMFRQADIVFLISESEKRFVAQYFGDKAAEKCQVTYNAIGWSRFEGGAVSEAVVELIAHPYILTVSHPFPHKNLSTLIAAFNVVAATEPDTKLYLVGKESAEKQRLIEKYAAPDVIDRIVMTGVVSDAELGALYRHTKLFALPSLYEGFGMPAAEALGLGAPTIVSGVTSLPEATLGQATYVNDPQDSNEWAERMIDMLQRGSRPSQELVNAVRSRFDPKHVAEALLGHLR